MFDLKMMAWREVEMENLTDFLQYNNPQKYRNTQQQLTVLFPMRLHLEKKEAGEKKKNE